MKLLRYIVVILAILFSCNEKKEATKAGEKLGFTITGTPINGEGYAYLQKYGSANEIIIVDSVALKNKAFLFKGHITNLEPYQVVVNEDVYPLVLENTNYLLSEGTIVGTKLQEDYSTYYEGLIQTENAFVYQRNFITSHPESMLAAVVLKTMLGKTEWRINQNKLAYNALSESIKASYLGKEIHQYIQTHENIIEENREVVAVESTKVSPNDDEINSKKVLPKKKDIAKKVTPKKTEETITYTGVNFEADDIYGNNFRLSDITTKSKYVLIDFWASWCAPCRKQNPYLVEVYNMYHNKGFDIVSVSEDRSKLAWENAVQTDGLTWHHVIDDFNRLTKLYNVESIPHTILINHKGDIIASDISPYILKTKLGGLLR